jgi:hypothetical protein
MLFGLIALCPLAAVAEVRLLTDAERELGEAWVEAVLSNDPDRVATILDLDALREHVTQGLNLPKEAQVGLRFGMRGLVNRMLQNVHEQQVPVTYDLLDHTPGPGIEGDLLARVTLGGGINYVGLVISDDGRRIIDLYQQISGEMLSETLRRNMVAMALADEQGQPMPVIDVTTDIHNAYVAGDFARVRQLYEAFDGEHWPGGHTSYINTFLFEARQTGIYGDEFHRALDLSKQHLGPLVAASAGYEAAMVRGDVEAALAFVDITDAAAGGDPLLDVLRAAAHVVNKDSAAAQEAIARAIEAEPDHPMPWETAIDVGLLAEDHDLTLRALTELRDVFGWTFIDLAAAEGFGAFVGTPQHEQWVASGG